MRLTELFEDGEDLKFNMAWANRLNTIPVNIRSRTLALAKAQLKRGESASDAISTGLDQATAEYNSRQREIPNVSKPQTPQQKSEPKRYSKTTGKKWGNQYHKDPASSGGIKGTIAKSNPYNIAKKGIEKANQKLGDLMDIDKAFATSESKKQ